VAILVVAGLVTAAPGAAIAPPRSLVEKCVQTDGVEAQPFWLTASDGARLYAIEAGSGPTTVVLMHESPADLCGWLPYAATLTQAGIKVLAFDFRNFGDSSRPPGRNATTYGRDVRAAVARARADGAQRVFLAGASFGGVAALTFGPSLPVAGVISMSGETRLGSMNALAAVRRLRAPLLILGSRHDRYLSIAEARSLIRRARTKDRRLAVYPGGFHGWSIVEEAPYAARARALVLGWLRARGAQAP
jgi:alpha-beta hydrolase superfamily lysophospholipase